MIQGFADIMQQAGAAGDGGIQPQFAGHNTGQVRHFQRVIQHVLTVAGAVTQPTQQLDQFGVNAVDTGLDNDALTLLLDGCLNLGGRLSDGFLNSRGVNTSVKYKLFKGHSGNFAHYRVEA